MPIKTAQTPPAKAERLLQDQIIQFVDDPYNFVRFAFPWGEEGPLKDYTGPDIWQKNFLKRLGEEIRKPGKNPIRCATKSGHGIGKSTLIAWIILWFISTRPHPQIRVTANTREQLLKTTFRELALWHKRAINSHWFVYTATKLYKTESPETWFAAAIPWSAENPEAFAGLHADHVLVVFDESCHDNKTEVLTDKGWRFFANLTGEEQLLTMDPATGRCFYERPTKLFVAPYEGEMWEYTNRGANFCVTPSHKMWEQRYSPHRPTHYTDWKATPISEIPNQQFYIPKTIPIWEGQHHTTFTIPRYEGRRKTWDAFTVPIEEWVQFLGWYYSEGSLSYQKDGHPYEVRITQKDTTVLESLRQMVDRWGCSTTIYTRTTTPQLSIRHRGLSEYLLSYGKGCLEIRLPPELREATREQQRLFLDAFCQGDGYIHRNRRILYTSNKGLADDLHEVALKAGYNSTVTTRKLKGVTARFATHTATSSCDGYAVSLAESNPRARIDQKHIRKIPYSGTVYCAEVPTHHLLMTRRNGNAMWSGNSNIHENIWEVTQGAMTTAKPLWLAFGNPTRNTGSFYECFGSQQHRWITTRVDSRTSKLANKDLIAQWIEDYGEDSDFVRVRVKGEFPRAGSTQFIPSDLVERAMRNRVVTDGQETRVLAVDVARFGDDQTIFLERHGSRVLPLTKYRGLDTMQVAALVAERIDATQPDCTFVDGTGLGAGVVDRLRSLNYRIIDVQAGGKPDDPEKYFNKRAEMWGRAREWLRGDVELPQDDGLKAALTGLEYGYSAKMAIQLEKKEDMKKRGLASPDEADALAYSFAEPVRAQRTVFIPQGLVRGAEAGWRGNKLRGSRRDLDWRVV